MKQDTQECEHHPTPGYEKKSKGADGAKERIHTDDRARRTRRALDAHALPDPRQPRGSDDSG